MASYQCHIRDEFSTTGETFHQHIKEPIPLPRAEGKASPSEEPPLRKSGPLHHSGFTFTGRRQMGGQADGAARSPQ
jgi:hypothetical protein